MNTRPDVLYERLADIACELSAGQSEALALEIEASASPRSINSIGGLSAPSSVRELCAEWKTSQVEGSRLAEALRCASRAIRTVSSYEKVELLYTGPATDALRRNQQALLEVVRGARRTLWVVSYVVYGAVDEVLAAMQERALAAVDVRVLVDHLGESGQHALERLAADAPDCQAYIWPAEARRFAPDRIANLHAKCAVADGQQAYVSSANLTGQALDHNLEVGYLVTGGVTPAALERYLTRLVEEDVIVVTS